VSKGNTIKYVNSDCLLQQNYKQKEKVVVRASRVNVVVRDTLLCLLLIQLIKLLGLNRYANFWE
jgi:hypothetical protein